MNKAQFARIVYYMLYIIEIPTFIPQICRLIRTKCSKDISIPSQILYLVMNYGWIAYFIATEVTMTQLAVALIVDIEVTLQFILVLVYRRDKYSKRTM